jgi:glycosyltransferase involved in cell wall biosynthesis
LKILIISFYYYPDLCAGSFRTTALVKQLCQQTDSSIDIEVLTTLPNRYASYQAQALALESKPGLTIRRIKLPKHRSGMLDQAIAFAYFAKEVQRLTRKNRYALVYATSSRLMAATLGAWVAHQQHAKLYLDIRDLFVETIHDVFPSLLAKCAKPVFSWLEKWSFQKATRMNLVSKGFQPYIAQRYPKLTLRWFTNGIDQEFLDLHSESMVKQDELVTVLYAGNIGEGQGLHKIIPELAKKMHGRIQFKLIGDGGRRTQLEALVQDYDCHNVILLPPLNREDLIREYQNADFLFLHLNDYDAFRKVLPSKLFEYAALGKPIWAGVAGYCAEFIKSEISNAAVFEPCNVADAMTAFSTLTMQTQQRTDFIHKYKRSHIMTEMAGDILSLMQ